MKPARWVWWTLLVIGVLLVVFGVFVLGFRSEPSVVGRMRTLLEGIGYGSIALGVAGGASGLWMLVRRRT